METMNAKRCVSLELSHNLRQLVTSSARGMQLPSLQVDIHPVSHLVDHGGTEGIDLGVEVSESGVEVGD
jgi:hypothetical protein